ncbi:patched family-domain-containing protein [Pavlovales sp. CCMP2436]|nr:patched family-domain-containing protein [Pavlovales sp. CCMP2436]
MIIYTRMPQLHEEAFAQWEGFNRIIADAGARGYAYHPKYEFGAVDRTMLQFALGNLAWATLAILCVLLAFLTPTVALVSTLSVLSIDTVLFGLMVMMRVRLNSITLISLLIALALAIDYSCHLGHAYEAAPAITRRAKAAWALETMGASILSAGTSTLLGTLFLAISRSPVFRTFFVLVWGTILWGLIAGLAIVPAALGLMGPLETHAPPSPPLRSSRVAAAPLPPPAPLPASARLARPAEPRHVREEPAECAAAEQATAVAADGEAADEPKTPVEDAGELEPPASPDRPSPGRSSARRYRAHGLGSLAEEGEPAGWRTAPVSPAMGVGPPVGVGVGSRLGAGGAGVASALPMSGESVGVGASGGPIPPVAPAARPGQSPNGYGLGTPSGAAVPAGAIAWERGPAPRYSSACRGALL